MFVDDIQFRNICAWKHASIPDIAKGFFHLDYSQQKNPQQNTCSPIFSGCWDKSCEFSPIVSIAKGQRLSPSLLGIVGTPSSFPGIELLIERFQSRA